MSSSNASGDRGERSHGFIAFLETLAKVGTVLAAFGYVSLRAHFNRLGLPLPPYVGVERLAAEAFNLLVAGTALMVLSGGPVLVLVVVLVIAVAAAREAIARARGRTAQDQNSEMRFTLRPWTLISAIVSIHLCVGIAILRDPRIDIAVGDLCRSALYSGHDSRPLFVLAVIAALLVSIAQQGLRQRGALSPHASLGISFGLFLLLGVQLPLLYGAAIRSSEYPEATVDLGASGKLSGLLVLDSPDEVRLWRAEMGRGEVVIISRDKIDTMTLGRVRDLVRTALDSAPAAVQCH